jgi:glycosyltransferase involved in cell wall biosynthesis
MPRLPPTFKGLVDEVTSSLNPCFNGAPAIFVDGSPMTHDTRFGLRFQSHPNVLKAAVLYDFIPLDWPGYLPTVPSRINYMARIGRLRQFDLFFPISEYTALRLSELLAVPRDRVHVTGACVRRSLYELRDLVSGTHRKNGQIEPYFVTFGGDDKRKNTEVAVRAVRHLNLVYARRIPLKVIGFYNRVYKSELLHLAGHSEGEGFLEFHPSTQEEKVFYDHSTDGWRRPSVSDSEVFSLHAGAIAAIAPSHIEGFSLPVVEAALCGCPVIASTCAAHLELIDREEALFPSDDAAVLCEKLDAVLNDASLRDSLVQSQSHLGPKFHEDAVGKRFWGALELAVEYRSISASKHHRKPRLAFLSPCPRDGSDIAGHTALAVAADQTLFGSDLYTDSARPLAFESGSLRDSGRVSLATLLNTRYKAVISVLGNSSAYDSVFGVFERYGGPCILQDARLTQLYFHRLGQEKFLSFASKLLARPVSLEEVHRDWLHDRNLPSLFLDPVIERASPLIVDSPAQRTLIKEHYGVESHVITCCPTSFFGDEEISTSTRRMIRERHGINSTAFIVSSFGPVRRANGMDTCILAVELLRSWNVPAELFFIGDANAEEAEVHRVAALYDIAKYVHCGAAFTSEVMKRDFLIASDVAIQLREYGFGKLSVPVIDCISAGLPCVTTSDMAESCDAPSYVSTVPDRFSPLQVAEQLALIWEAGMGRSSHLDARAAYLETHNSESSAKRLLEILEIA